MINKEHRRTTEIAQPLLCGWNEGIL